jgi:hypothetical protein
MVPQRGNAQGREQLWRERIASQQTSGQTVAAWCRDAGVAKQSFYAWRRRLAAGDESRRTPQVAPVALPVQITSLLPPPAPLEMQLPSGVVLRIAAGCDARLLREALLAVRSLDAEPSAGRARPC